ncbi:MAG: periplasmic heavy metal sensor [Candidatus Marinimicrobia bacterium]|nr:periplasmic heavy metal sensor [Candidatus Neomarinimicrobiota bacterium]MCF7839923.1 periplasmic heavy metal sensor [Candidatus Neomarinimicrobiota bacterium]MCF7901998.1 periplasmic heavy metal sensor [Candidatus Neomarinimicrobiota bacterium]
MKRIVFITLTALAVTLLNAQHPDMAPTPGEALPRNVEAVRIYKLTQALNLTDDQITTFIPALQRHEEQVRDAQRELHKIMNEGRTLLNNDKVNQKDVDKFISRVNQQQARVQQLNQDFLNSLSQHLTPRQQLQFLGFEERFRRQLREFIQQRRDLPDRPDRPSRR